MKTSTYFYCRDTSCWLAVFSLEVTNRVVEAACPVDSATGGGLLSGVRPDH